MLIWSEEFATGSPVIDGQHRELIERVNQLGGLICKSNPNRDDIEFIVRFLDYLEDYALTHFNYEEQCMENFRCPMHGQNKEAHACFTQMFRRYKDQFSHAGFRMELLTELHRFASSWIQGHILHVDTQLKPCVRRAGP